MVKIPECRKDVIDPPLTWKRTGKGKLYTIQLTCGVMIALTRQDASMDVIQKREQPVAQK